MDEATREALRVRLEDSGFMHMRSGMAYGLLSWLLGAGLLLVYYGNTAHDNDDVFVSGGGDTSRGDIVAWAVVLGWTAAALAVVGTALLLARFARFARDLRTWTRAETALDPVAARETRLERRLRSTSTRGSRGPADPFVFGGLLVPPFGLVVTPLAVLVTLLSLGKAVRGGDGLSSSDRVQIVVAFLAAAFCASLVVVAMSGLISSRGQLSRWRDAGRDRRTGPA